MDVSFYFADIIPAHLSTYPRRSRFPSDRMELDGAFSFVLCSFRSNIPSLFTHPHVIKTDTPYHRQHDNYIQPIIASLIAVMIGQDTFSLQKIVSAVLVFVGVYLVTQSKSREDLEKERTDVD